MVFDSQFTKEINYPFIKQCHNFILKILYKKFIAIMPNAEGKLTAENRMHIIY